MHSISIFTYLVVFPIQPFGLGQSLDVDARRCAERRFSMGELDQQGRTDRLASLLEFAISSKHTGICNVERGKGGVRQFGKLIFLDGQLIDATADSRTGLAAWDWLKIWSYCQYTFVTQNREEIKVPTQPATSSDISNPTPSPLSMLSQMLEKVTHSLTDSIAPTSAVPESPSSGEILQENVGWTEPVTEPPQQPSRGPLTPIPYSTSPMNRFPPNGASGVNGMNSMSGIGGNGMNNSMSGIGGNGYQQGMNYVPNQWNSLTPPQLPVSLPSPVPMRLIDGDDALRLIERYRLSRHHRHIFFLLNGQRSAADIVRLTRRPLYEIQQVLEDLEQYGLIRL
jgi:hypothetical protein